MKFLVDECLSQELAKAARARGHVQSAHVTWIGERGSQDWTLMHVILDGDWTFVTRNACDFRGPTELPGTRGLYGAVELHAGLVCLTAPDMDLDLQLDLFSAAMDELEARPDLVNQVVEIIAASRRAETFEVRRYALPRP